MPKGRKLKVGLVFDDTLDSSDGVAQYVKTVGAWLSANGHEVTYLVGETRASFWEGGKIVSLAKNVNVRFNGNKLSMPLLPRRKLIRQTLKANDYDVLHVMLPCSPFMAGRVIAAADKNTAVVGTFHIFPSGWLSRFGSKLLRIALIPTLRRMDAVVSVSRPAMEFAYSAYGISSKILPNPVNLNEYKLDKNNSVDPDKIVFLGRLVPRKGCAELLAAFNIVTKKLPQAYLVVAGAGEQQDHLKKMVSSMALQEKVTFLGYVEESHKRELLGSAGLACFPSLYGESFGIVLLEAMAAGALVLAGDNPGYRSVMESREEALVDPRDTELFAEKIIGMMCDNKLRSKLTAWQRAAIGQYDINIVGPKLLGLYESSIANKAESSHNSHHG